MDLLAPPIKTNGLQKKILTFACLSPFLVDAQDWIIGKGLVVGIFQKALKHQCFGPGTSMRLRRIFFSFVFGRYGFK